MKRTVFTLLLLAVAIAMLAACGAPASARRRRRAAAAPAASAGDSGLPVDVPRESVFVADQIFRYSVIDNYNFWVNGPHEPHRHALMMETLWYRDQETGERIYGAAASDPVYNDDFTQMNVDLRDNLYWSDGVQFTADDLVYTVELLHSNPGMNKSGGRRSSTSILDSVEKTGDFSVQFNLLESNPRFHTLFETRWNGMYMMPKHIFETVDDPTTFTFSKIPSCWASTCPSRAIRTASGNSSSVARTGNERRPASSSASLVLSMC